MRLPVLLIAMTLLFSGCEYIPVSSGELAGKVTAIPDDWSMVAAKDIIQFETNPADPYSVNLWVVEIDGDLFVYAGENRATWIENIEANDEVRLGMDGLIYELRAQRVIDQTLFDRFAELWKSKYGNYPRSRVAEDTYLMRLTPR